MKKFVVMLSLVVGAWMLSPTPAAQAWSWGGSNKVQKVKKAKKAKKPKKVKKVKKPKIGGVSIPELDPSAAGGAMILLVGGVAYIASRRRNEDLA